MTQETIFFAEGRGARRSGQTVEDCPYRNTPSMDAVYWYRGWHFEDNKTKALTASQPVRQNLVPALNRLIHKASSVLAAPFSTGRHQ